MTAQKRFTPQQEAQYAFQKRYCRTKVWLALQNGQTKTFFADDCSATWLQLACGHVHEVEYSYAAGMEYALAKEKYFKGRYQVLHIYRRELSVQWPPEPVFTFSCFGSSKALTDELPPNIRCTVRRIPGTNFLGYDVELKPIIAPGSVPVAATKPNAVAGPPTPAEKATAAVVQQASDRIAQRWNISR